MKKSLRTKDTNGNSKYKEGERVALPIHPGEILREELLIPRNISFQELADDLKVPKELIQCVCEEKDGITLDLARRLSIYFDTSIDLWLNLQKSYEEEMAELEFELLKKEIMPYKKIKRSASIRGINLQRFKHA